MSQHFTEKRYPRRGLLASLAAFGIGSGLSVAAGGAERWIPRFGITFHGSLPCLPRHDYQHKPRSPSLIAASLPAQAIESAANEVKLRTVASERELTLFPRRKRFRPNRVSLRIDHCEVDSIVLDIGSDGQWVMSLVGLQNPPLRPDQTQRFQENIHLKRNEFHFEARLLGSTGTPLADIDASDVFERQTGAGRLIAARICPPNFWVQREQPRTMRWRGVCHDVMNAFNDADSCEFEFYYHLDPMSAAGENVRRLEER